MSDVIYFNIYKQENLVTLGKIRNAFKNIKIVNLKEYESIELEKIYCMDKKLCKDTSVYYNIPDEKFILIVYNFYRSIYRDERDAKRKIVEEMKNSGIVDEKLEKELSAEISTW